MNGLREREREGERKGERLGEERDRERALSLHRCAAPAKLAT